MAQAVRAKVVGAGGSGAKQREELRSCPPPLLPALQICFHLLSPLIDEHLDDTADAFVVVVVVVVG